MDDPSDIIVDVAICGYTADPDVDLNNHAFHNFMQAKSVHDYYVNTDSLWGQAAAFPGLDMRYYFQERTGCPGSGGLNFNNSTTWCL